VEGEFNVTMLNAAQMVGEYPEREIYAFAETESRARALAAAKAAVLAESTD